MSFVADFAYIFKFVNSAIKVFANSVVKHSQIFPQNFIMFDWIMYYCQYFHGPICYFFYYTATIIITITGLLIFIRFFSILRFKFMPVMVRPYLECILGSYFQFPIFIIYISACIIALAINFVLIFYKIYWILWILNILVTKYIFDVYKTFTRCKLEMHVWCMIPMYYSSKIWVPISKILITIYLKFTTTNWPVSIGTPISCSISVKGNTYVSYLGEENVIIW